MKKKKKFKIIQAGQYVIRDKIRLGGKAEIGSLDDIPYDASCPIPKGSRVRKTKSDAEGDVTPIGAEGITVGGMAHLPLPNEWAYVVKWDKPSVTMAGTEFTVSIVDHTKIELIK